MRAYGNTAAQCLRSAEKKERIERINLKFVVDFSDTYAVYGLITQKKLVKTGEDYTASGVQFELGVEADAAQEIRMRLNDLTRARIQWLDEV